MKSRYNSILVVMAGGAILGAVLAILFTGGAQVGTIASGAILGGFLGLLLGFASIIPAGPGTQGGTGGVS